MAQNSDRDLSRAMREWWGKKLVGKKLVEDDSSSGLSRYLMLAGVAVGLWEKEEKHEVFSSEFEGVGIAD